MTRLNKRRSKRAGVAGSAQSNGGKVYADLRGRKTVQRSRAKQLRRSLGRMKHGVPRGQFHESYFCEAKTVHNKFLTGGLCLHPPTEIPPTCNPGAHKEPWVDGSTKSLGEYVDTLVHELTHCWQNKHGKPNSEEQAYEAGIRAAAEYMREAAPWLKR